MADSAYVKSLPFLVGLTIILSLSILGLLIYAVVMINSGMNSINQAISRNKRPHCRPRSRTVSSGHGSDDSDEEEEYETGKKGARGVAPRFTTARVETEREVREVRQDREERNPWKSGGKNYPQEGASGGHHSVPLDDATDTSDLEAAYMGEQTKRSADRPGDRGADDRKRAKKVDTSTTSSRTRAPGLSEMMNLAAKSGTPHYSRSRGVDTGESHGGEWERDAVRTRGLGHGLDAGVSDNPPSRREPRRQVGTRLAKDATVLGTTLYVLDEDGNVAAKSLLTSEEGRSKVCRVEAPPAPLTSVDSVRGEIVGRTRSGELFVLQPCSDPTCSRTKGAQCEGGVARWRRPPVQSSGLRYRSVADGDVDLTAVTHLSTSPDGSRVWVQDRDYGRLFEISDTGEWIPLGNPVRNGGEGVRRVIGDGDFVDLHDRRAVRNLDRTTMRSGVDNAVYPGGESRALPIFTDASRKRVADGVVASLPCAVDDLLNLCRANSRQH